MQQYLCILFLLMLFTCSRGISNRGAAMTLKYSWAFFTLPLPSCRKALRFSAMLASVLSGVLSRLFSMSSIPALVTLHHRHGKVPGIEKTRILNPFGCVLFLCYLKKWLVSFRLINTEFDQDSPAAPEMPYMVDRKA